MGDNSGPALPPGAVLTREVRWIHAGAIPRKVQDWFNASNGSVFTEHRIDRYDEAAARRGMGLKSRSTGEIESKTLLARNRNVTLSPQMTGHVEDWVKIQVSPSATELNGWDDIVITKDITTRRFVIPSTTRLDGGTAGCEVELATVTTEQASWWTVCFETFGPPELRDEAFEYGLEMLLSETPLHEDIVFQAKNSYSYPDWIAAKSGLQLDLPA